MDCFKSGLDCPPDPEVGVAFDERLTGGCGSCAKKSNPSRESAGFEIFGGGAGAAWKLDCLEEVPGVEFALCIVEASPASRSACGARRTVAGLPPGAEPGTALCEVERWRSCFSFTKFKGISSSPSTSRVAGSGIGPSMTHLFESYFVRMKFSIFASDGTCPGASLASQYLFARELPHTSTLCSCSSVQESRSTDLTRLMCVPIPRWMPEQRMQTKMPRFQLAHRGSTKGRR